jgi:hypothetical protein
VLVKDIEFDESFHSPVRAREQEPMSEERIQRLQTAGISIGLAVASFVLLFATRAATQYGDSLRYIQSARTGDGIFFPHHILYNTLIRALFLGAEAVRPGIDALIVGQVHNILWAAVAVVVMFAIVRRMTGSVRWAFVAALGLLVCQGFWEYATQTQIYVPAMAVLALLAWTLLRIPPSILSIRDCFLVGGLYVLSILYHQSNVLFAIPMVFFILRKTGLRNWKRLLVIVAVSGGIVLLLYIAAFRATDSERTVSGFIRYALDYTYHPAPNWGTWKNISPVGLGYLLFSQLRNIVTVFDPVQKLMIVFFAVILAALMIDNLRRMRRNAAAESGRALFWIWLGVHFAFFLWWAPHDKNMFTISLFPLIILFLLSARDSKRGVGPSRISSPVSLAAAVIGLAVLAGVNYATFIKPLHDSRGADYEEARRLDAGVPPGDFILTNFDVQQNLVYHFKRRHALLIDIAAISFCRELHLPAAYGDLQNSTFVFSPDYFFPDSRLSLISGYDNPKGWKKFLAWLFELEVDAVGKVVSGRTFSALEPVGYLRIGTERIALSGWPDFLGRLDKFVQVNFEVPPGIFERWWRTTGMEELPRQYPGR